MLTTSRILPVAVPYLTDAAIESQAATLITAYEIACGPIKFPLDVQDLIWSLVGSRDNLLLEEDCQLGCDQYGERVIGSTTGDYEGGIIRVDASITETPLFWITIAHELGHWILHRSLLAFAYNRAKGKGNCGMPTLRRNLEEARSSKTPPEEWQANRFAVHLLMPEKNVRMLFAEMVSQKPLNYREKCQSVGRFIQEFPTLRDYTRMLTGQNRPFNMRNRFRVSKEAMAIRLEELNLVIDKAPGEN